MEEELQLDVAAEVVEMEGVEPRLGSRVVIEHARLRQHLHARENGKGARITREREVSQKTSLSACESEGVEG